MKTTSTQFTRCLLLCVVPFAVQSAFAFYDSGLGRWINRDPIGERGDVNLYRVLGNHPVNGIDPFGLDVRIGWPNTGNCYTYVCNNPKGPTIPGRGNIPFPPGQSTCENVTAGLKKDHPEATLPDAGGNCPAGTRLISIFANGNDFHFHRQDNDCNWSHKPGRLPPGPVLGPVLTPTKNPSYKFCGQMCIGN